MAVSSCDSLSRRCQSRRRCDMPPCPSRRTSGRVQAWHQRLWRRPRYEPAPAQVLHVTCPEPLHLSHVVVMEEAFLSLKLSQSASANHVVILHAEMTAR